MQENPFLKPFAAAVAKIDFPSWISPTILHEYQYIENTAIMTNVIFRVEFADNNGHPQSAERYVPRWIFAKGFANDSLNNYGKQIIENVIAELTIKMESFL